MDNAFAFYNRLWHYYDVVESKLCCWWGHDMLDSGLSELRWAIVITIIIWVMSSPVSQSRLIIPSWSVWWTQADLEVSEQAWHQSAFTQHCDNIIKLMQNYCANCSGWISMRILYGAQMCKQVNNNQLDNLHSCLSGNWQAQVIIPSPKKQVTTTSTQSK